MIGLRGWISIPRLPSCNLCFSSWSGDASASLTEFVVSQPIPEEDLASVISTVLPN